MDTRLLKNYGINSEGYQILDVQAYNLCTGDDALTYHEIDIRSVTEIPVVIANLEYRMRNDPKTRFVEWPDGDRMRITRLVLNALYPDGFRHDVCEWWYKNGRFVTPTDWDVRLFQLKHWIQMHTYEKVLYRHWVQSLGHFLFPKSYRFTWDIRDAADRAKWAAEAKAKAEEGQAGNSSEKGS